MYVEVLTYQARRPQEEGPFYYDIDMIPTYYSLFVCPTHLKLLSYQSERKVAASRWRWTRSSAIIQVKYTMTIRSILRSIGINSTYKPARADGGRGGGSSKPLPPLHHIYLSIHQINGFTMIGLGALTAAAAAAGCV